MDLQTLERRDQVFQIGEPTVHIYVVLEGRVKIYRSRRVGRQVTLAILKPGDVFGEDALTVDGVHEQGVEALETTTIGALAAGEFRALLEQKPILAWRVLQNLGQQKRLLERKIADLVFNDVPTRLAEVLLGLAEDYGETVPTVSRWSCASRSRISPISSGRRAGRECHTETVSGERLIYPRPYVICIADRDGLRRVAETPGGSI